MNLDATACAYGLFQVAFAEMVESLAVAVYELRKHRDNSLTINLLPNLGKPGRLLTDLKKELRQFEEYDAQDSYVQEVRRACGEAQKVLDWRNPRIHCRILRTETGVSLQSWGGEPLPLTAEDCWAYINRAIAVSTTVQAYVHHLVGALEFYRAVDDVHAEILAREYDDMADEITPEDEIYAQILADEISPEDRDQSVILAEDPEIPR